MLNITETIKSHNQINKLESSRTLVIIDPNITNPLQLEAGIIPGTIVRILDAHRDGINQITDILREIPHLDTLHLLGHGSPGCIYLGNSQLSLDTLPQYEAAIATWFSTPSPKTPSLLLYGCNVAAGETGVELLSQLQQLTKAQIQASSSKVGNVNQGGNWELDVSVGDFLELTNTEIAINLATQKVYEGILAAPVANNDPVIYPTVINLSDLDGSNGFVLNGIDEGDLSGYSVSNAGDINGDGIDDLIIGAENADSHGNEGAGESYVIFGGRNVGSTGTLELSALNGSNGFVLNGIDAGDASGSSVSNAGDINGDGIDDLIIGASRADPHGNERAGESYVVFGGSNVGSSGTIELSDLDGSNGFILNGIDAGDCSGSVSNAEDINGDGIDDLIIGAFFADPNSNNSGESYVVFGGSNVGRTGTLELSALDGSNGFVLNGIDEHDLSGFSVSNGGDLNGDGIDDLIIGAQDADPHGNFFAGESYVVFGSSNVGSTGTLELSALDGSNGFILNGGNSSSGERSGFSVSNAGDINGDGIGDLIIGAPYANTLLGKSYVIFGGSHVGNTGTIELSALNGSNGFVLNGIDGIYPFYDYSGVSVSNAGDINGDGIDDLIIGASESGKSYVVFGHRNIGSSGIFELSTLDGSNGFVLNGINNYDFAGRSVSNAGDINGDGTDDLIIGAYGADPNGDYSGESYVVFGRDFNTDEDTAFTTSNVLANDTDADGDTLTIASIDTTGTLGLVINNGDGTFNYDPLNIFANLVDGQSATDSFSYTVTDGNSGFDSATVIITIHGITDGTPFDHFLSGNALDNTLAGGDGNDTLHGNLGNDKLFGGNDHDVLNGGAGQDTLYGNLGNDQLYGGNDRDVLNGGEGQDTLYGNLGNDQLYGGNANDILNGGEGQDTLYGNLGNDQLYGGNDRDVLNGGEGQDTLYGNLGNDQLYGGNDRDVLNGGEGQDTLYGHLGNDKLYGGVGSDILLGNNNDDLLSGGLGLDSLTGGAGKDRFSLVSGLTADRDIIQDYQDGWDRLVLTGGLTFDHLTINQNGANTDIIETNTNQTLATLTGINAMTIDNSDFV